MPVWHEGPPYWGLCVFSFYWVVLASRAFLPLHRSHFLPLHRVIARRLD